MFVVFLSSSFSLHFCVQPVQTEFFFQFELSRFTANCSKHSEFCLWFFQKIHFSWLNFNFFSQFDLSRLNPNVFLKSDFSRLNPNIFLKSEFSRLNFFF